MLSLSAVIWFYYRAPCVVLLQFCTHHSLILNYLLRAQRKAVPPRRRCYRFHRVVTAADGVGIALKFNATRALWFRRHLLRLRLLVRVDLPRRSRPMRWRAINSNRLVVVRRGRLRVLISDGLSVSLGLMRWV